MRQLEEASILRQLSLDPHPNIVRFIDSWEHCGRLYIRTELAPYGDLSTFLEAMTGAGDGGGGGLGEIRVWKTLIELGEAINHVHANGLLHLDIKPSNVLIREDGGLMLGDFGMATVASEGSQLGLSPVLPEEGPDGGFIWDIEESKGDLDGVNDGAQKGDELVASSCSEVVGSCKSSRTVNVVMSPMIDREHEGDREYLCPEALKGEVGKAADIFR
jgi:mitosis inhibitor protein kinase SWE1